MTQDRRSEKNAPSHPLRWFPEFLELSHRRLRPRARLLGFRWWSGSFPAWGLSSFTWPASCSSLCTGRPVRLSAVMPPAESRRCLQNRTARCGRGCCCSCRPSAAWSAASSSSRLAPEAEGHGTDAAIAAYHFHQGQFAAGAVGEAARQCPDHRHRRLGRPGRADRPDRGRLRLLAGHAAPPPAGRAARPDGRRHGRGRRRHLSAPRSPAALFAAEILYRSPDSSPR